LDKETQEFILQLLKEGREWISACAPYLSALVAWLIPSPVSLMKMRQDKQMNDDSKIYPPK
jgi:hypothetical protein